jgi:hypothetical protein
VEVLNMINNGNQVVGNASTGIVEIIKEQSFFIMTQNKF